MVSRRERLDLAARISGVMKGLCGVEGQVIVRRGACLSIKEEMTELNSLR